MSINLIAGAAGVAVFLIILIILFNRLVRLRLAVKNAWADVDVHLKKRHELLPNLVETVKGYARHESKTLEKVTSLRQAAVGALELGPGQAGVAEALLLAALGGMIGLVEAYPDLKANKSFQDLMAKMTKLDDNIEYARRYYNASVREYNTATETFPISIAAAAFAFLPAEFFSIDDAGAARLSVKVDFKGAV